MRAGKIKSSPWDWGAGSENECRGGCVWLPPSLRTSIPSPMSRVQYPPQWKLLPRKTLTLQDPIRTFHYRCESNKLFLLFGYRNNHFSLSAKSTLFLSRAYWVYIPFCHCWEGKLTVEVRVTFSILHMCTHVCTPPHTHYSIEWLPVPFNIKI